VCIVSWNTREMLRGCLESVLQHAGELKLEVIVTDNASSDGSPEMVRADFPSLTLIANDDNRGFGTACNQAVEEARARHILFLNSDTVVLPGALEAMVGYLDEHPLVGAVGCKLLNSDGSSQRSCWLGFVSLRTALIDALYLWKLLPRSRFVKQSEVDTDQAAVPFAVDHLLGACIAVPRRVLDEVGVFDVRFFMFLEETDLCYRINKGGYAVHFLPDEEIIHYGGASTRQVADMKRRLYKSQIVFLRKYLVSPPYLAAFKGITAVGALVRIMLWTFRLLARPGKRMSAAAIATYARTVLELPGY
jgi:GT2 family glycosyltransferase